MGRDHALIVVADDDADYIDLMGEALSAAGYEVRGCAASGDALALIVAVRPDLVVLDLRMETPRSGLDILRRLRAHEETVSLPVLLCSADARFLRDNAAELQAQDCTFIEKPFDLDDLLSTVAALLGSPWDRSSIP